MKSSGYQKLKAVIDWILAVIALIVLSPLFLLISLLIRLDSRGPAFYRQERIGQGGKVFIIFKFRTMKIDTPNLSTEEMRKSGYDPYTRVGRLLRKTSLDELPQLINIIKGEMSIVGPRPALPSQTDVNTLREAKGVHAVRSGITGLAQVMGRDDLDTETKVGYDAEYCRRMSILFDVKVVLMTVVAIVTSRGNK